MQYNEKLTGNLSDDFELFVGARPHMNTDRTVVQAVVDFFSAHFGNTEYDPEEEDEVIIFNQMVPAGAYGSPTHSDAYRAHYPDYTDAMDEAINDAWLTLED